MASDNRSTKKKRESTGLRTSAGIEISSQNARSHGLTAGPDVDSVQQWFFIILNKPDAKLHVEDVLTLAKILALSLAHAEVQLKRTHLALAAFEAKDDPLLRDGCAENGAAVVILNRNALAFYCVPADEYHVMVDRLDDIELNNLVEARKGGPFVEVGLGEL